MAPSPDRTSLPQTPFSHLYPRLGNRSRPIAGLVRRDPSAPGGTGTPGADTLIELDFQQYPMYFEGTIIGMEGDHAKESTSERQGQRRHAGSGQADPDFPDLPLGGWAGTARKVDRTSKGILVLIEWDTATLKRVQAVYLNRCVRDGLEHESMWLAEGNLEPVGEEPLSIEAPERFVSRPLSENDEEDRIRIALGLTSDHPLPDVDEGTLCRYHKYLAERLSFPFAGVWSDETGFLEGSSYLVLVTGLAAVEEHDEDHGLLCRARRGRETVELPLAGIEIDGESPNRRLIEDYSAWFWG